MICWTTKQDSRDWIFCFVRTLGQQNRTPCFPEKYHFTKVKWVPFGESWYRNWLDWMNISLHHPKCFICVIHQQQLFVFVKCSSDLIGWNELSQCHSNNFVFVIYGKWQGKFHPFLTENKNYFLFCFCFCHGQGFGLYIESARRIFQLCVHQTNDKNISVATFQSWTNPREANCHLLLDSGSSAFFSVLYWWVKNAYINNVAGKHPLITILKSSTYHNWVIKSINIQDSYTWGYKCLAIAAWAAWCCMWSWWISSWLVEGGGSGSEQRNQEEE